MTSTILSSLSSIKVSGREIRRFLFKNNFFNFLRELKYNRRHNYNTLCGILYMVYYNLNIRNEILKKCILITYLISFGNLVNKLLPNDNISNSEIEPMATGNTVIYNRINYV